MNQGNSKKNPDGKNGTPADIQDVPDSVEDARQTAEPGGQFPDAPDTLKDTERPGNTQNRHDDRGGTS